MRRLPWLLALAPLASSCGSSSDPDQLTRDGELALGTNDFAAARASFGGALDSLPEGDSDPLDPLFLRAKLGWIEATAASDPATAATELVALHEAAPGAVSDRDFSRIAGRMPASAEGRGAAKDLLAAAKQANPASGYLDALGERLAREARDVGDDGVLDALGGLGYGGGE